MHPFTVHPIALMFPRPTADERESLKDSIRRLGFRAPVTAWKGPDGTDYIIDGATRIDLRDEFARDGITTAENGAVLEPEVKWFSGSELEAADHAFALFTRRDATKSQKAAVAVKAGGMRRRLEAKERGDDPATLKAEKSGELAERVAARAGVNKSYIYDVCNIAETQPDLLDRIAEGIITIPQAKQVVKRRAAGLLDFEPEGGDPEPAKPPVVAKPTEVRDGLGRPVHPDFADAFLARKAVARLRTDLAKTLKEVQHVCDGPGGRCMVFGALKTDINNARKHLQHHQPFIVCPICTGSGDRFDPATGEKVPGEKCAICGGRKYVDELQYAELPETMRNELEGKAGDETPAADGAATPSPAAGGELPPAVPAGEPDPNATRSFAPGETTPDEWDAPPTVPAAPVSSVPNVGAVDGATTNPADDAAAFGELPDAAPVAETVPPAAEDDPFAL